MGLRAPSRSHLCGWYIYLPSLLDKDSPRQNTTVFLQIIYAKRVQFVYLGAKMLPQFPLVSLHSYQLINKTVWCRGPWSVALCTYEHTAGTVVGGGLMHIRTYAVPRDTPIQPFIYRCIIQNLCNWCIQVPIGYISCLICLTFMRAVRISCLLVVHG